MQSQHSNTPGNGGSDPSRQEDIGQRAREMSEEAKSAARDRAMDEAEGHKQEASNVAGAGARAFDSAARSLDEQGQETLAQTTSSLASSLSQFAGKLEHKNAEELLQDAARLARQNPAMFVVGGIGAGLVLSRFFKASSSSQGRQY
jgi:hypothetical protein